MASIAASPLAAFATTLAGVPLASKPGNVKTQVMRCAVVKCSQKSHQGEVTTSRRTAFAGIAAGSLALLFSAPNADAADIPLFGIKKAKQAVNAAADAAAGAASGAAKTITEAAESVVPSVGVSIDPTVQAGIVVAGEVVAVTVAAAVVGSLTNVYLA